MPSISRVPVFRSGLADQAGIFLSWVAVSEMGALYIVNRGPDTVFMAFDALPASATIGDGRQSIELGDTVNLDDVSYSQIGLLCAAAETAVVEAIGLIRPGNSGAGIN
jgi:hypothetical protein